MQSNSMKQLKRLQAQRVLFQQSSSMMPLQSQHCPQGWGRFLSMMVDGQPKNMPNCYSTSPRTSMNGIKSDCKSCGTGSKLMRDLIHSLTWREKGDVQLQSIKHINGVSKNGKLRARLAALTMLQFHAAPLQQELRLCVHFLMSMQLFVRMIQRWLHFLNQQSRRLHPLVDDLCHQYSSLMQSLQGLVHCQCNLHHLQLHDQLMLPVRDFHWQQLRWLRVIHLVLQLKHFQSILLWRRVLVPISIHWSHRQHRLRRASMFDARHVHTLLSLKIKSMWQHQQQLRWLSLADHVRKVLQPSSCLHFQSLRLCIQMCTPKIRDLAIRSVLDIDWSRPLSEQLAPVLKGGPDPTKSQDELRARRAQVPELSNHLFDGIFPKDNVITVEQKSHGVHKIHLREAAAWVLNGTHWFSTLQQPMMIIVWCHNWEDASKFQYLMQILQAHFHDFVPPYQIFMYDHDIYGSFPQWQEPSTVWDGTPVIGFMAETLLDDLSTVGFKDFNPMWTFPTTSVNQCWDAMTFGMPPWHVGKDADLNKSKAKEAFQSQSPIAAFEACNMLQALGIAHSKIVLPSGDSKP